MTRAKRPLGALVLGLAAAGCGGGPATPGATSSIAASDESTPAVVGPTIPIEVDLTPFDLDAVEVSTETGGATAEGAADFEPPSLEELQARTDWVNQEVVDPLDRIKAYLETLPEPPSKREAMSLRNNSDADNAKLALFFGQQPGSDGQIDFDAEFVISEPADVKTTNPLVQSSVIEQRLQGFINPGIWGFDRDLEPFAIAESVASWKKTEDETVYLVTLRDDLLWSDGEPITAYDVEFSFHAIMDEEVPAVAVRQGTDELLGVKAYDDRTVAYFHPESRPTNIWNVNFPIIPKHIYSETIYGGQPAGTPKADLPESADKTMANSPRHVELEDRPVVGGPYEIIDRGQNQYITLQRRENWSTVDGREVRPRPRFKTIRLKTILDNNTALLSLKKGEIDYLNITPPQWMNQTGGDDFYERNTKIRGPEWTTYHILYNARTPYFDDPRVRLAVGLALDHETMLKDVLYGLYNPSRGVFNPDAWWAADPAPAPLGQDLDRAEDLLDEAGWDDSDGDGVRDREVDGKLLPFEFSVAFSTSDPNREKVATLWAENLDQIGIRAKPQPLEFTVLQQKSRDHEFDAQIGGWGVGADPYTTENIFASKAIATGRNYGQYSNETVDKLFTIAAKAVDRDDRAAAYGAIHKIMWNEQPYTWLYTRSTFVGMSKRLRGLTFSPRDPLGYTGGFEALWKPKAD